MSTALHLKGFSFTEIILWVEKKRSDGVMAVIGSLPVMALRRVLRRPTPGVYGPPNPPPPLPLPRFPVLVLSPYNIASDKATHITFTHPFQLISFGQCMGQSSFSRSSFCKYSLFLTAQNTTPFIHWISKREDFEKKVRRCMLVLFVSK